MSPLDAGCPHCGCPLSYERGGHVYSRAIVVEVAGVYDGGLFFRCPECGLDWHRWDNPRMKNLAAPYMRTCLV